MNKTIALLVTLSLIASSLISQEVSTIRSIHWQIPGTYSVKKDGEFLAKGKYLRFEGANYYNNDTRLPYFFDLIPIKKGQSTEIGVNILKASELEHNKVLNEKAASVIPNEIEVQSKVVKSSGDYYLQYFLLPLYKDKDGKVVKIEEFQLNYKVNEEKAVKEVKKSFVENSVFKDGKWVKISVEQNGVYKLTYEQLKSWGFSSFSNIGVFGNSEGVLSQNNADFEDKDPQQLALSYHLGGDQTFNEGDYVLFYAKSPHQWMYDDQKEFYTQIVHPYSSKNYYFITDNAQGSKNILQLNDAGGTASKQVNSYVDYEHYEKNEVNLIESGREWFGERFGIQNSYEFNFNFPNRVNDEPVKISTHLVARSTQTSSYNLFADQTKIYEANIGTVNFDFTGQYARSKRTFDSIYLPGDNLKLQLQYNPPNSSSYGWLDYITVNVVRELKMNGNHLSFRYRTQNPSETVEFVISGVQENITIWDITDPVNVKRISGISVQNGNATFKAAMDSTYKEFIAFTGDDYLQPKKEVSIPNQNLHGFGSEEMIIVTKEKFLSQAHELADLHQSQDGLKTAVVTDKQIFNEFSSGCPDPTAIRNFVRYIYEKSTPSDSLKYLLLFGDGSYDNRECHNNGNLFTYQSEASLHYSNSFVSDDFFGMIDETDDIEAALSGLVDVGIGRLPVNTVAEAANAVEKIKAYTTKELNQAWMNKIVFIADDEDNNDHVEDAELLSSVVTDRYGEFDVDKIYLDAYDQQTVATGQLYPGVNKDINEKVNNGVMLVNYSGHGGERYLAHERIITKEDIASWTNGDKMPVFMTGTCEFTRFDDPSYTSAGEEIFLRENGGAIALFSTTRLVYANQNYALNRAFYDFVFKRNSGKNFRLGDVVRLTKNNAGTDDNKRNFSLFGDPAIRLPIGEMEVKTDSIVPNDENSSDTIKALDKVTIYGHVENYSGTISQNYNGSLFVRIKGKENVFYTKANDGGSTFAYSLRDNVLFSGTANVEEGKFQVEFIVPKNLDPEFGNGKIIYWAKNEAIAQGSYKDFYIGGMSDNILDDSDGPAIDIYMNNRNFVSGGVTNENPVLLADLADQSGINISGEGVNHDIIATLDNKSSESIILNEYYQADANTYKEGSLVYQLNGLDKGRHTLTLEAWDINNNYSSSSIDFIVKESSQFELTSVANYPNPFSNNTQFYFEHNRPGEPMHLTLEVYSLTGRLVEKSEKVVQPDGFRVGPVQFESINNLKSKFGSGIYIYRLKIRLKEGEIAYKTGKMILLK